MALAPFFRFPAAAPLLAATLFGAFAHAAVIDVSYRGGKQYGSVVVPRSALQNGDTVKVGALRIVFNYDAAAYPAVCGAKPTIVAQFLGPFASFHQTADTSTDWDAFRTYPGSGLVPVDSIDGWPINVSSPGPLRAAGYPLFTVGLNSNCEGDEYFTSPGWNRIVFARMGSGVDYRAKLSFRVIDDTVYVGPPSFTTYQVLRGVRLDYVLNANSNDVHEPLISVAPRAVRGVAASRDWREMNLYNPLGVKVRREPGRFEAAVPARR